MFNRTKIVEIIFYQRFNSRYQLNWIRYVLLTVHCVYFFAFFTLVSSNTLVIRSELYARPKEAFPTYPPKIFSDHAHFSLTMISSTLVRTFFFRISIILDQQHVLLTSIFVFQTLSSYTRILSFPEHYVMLFIS